MSSADGKESGLLTINVESDFDKVRLGRSLESLEKALELDAENVRYRKTYAEALLAARRFNDAVDHLLVVYKTRKEPRIAYLIAYAYYRLHHLPSAERYLDEATTESGLGFSRLHVLRGRILYEKRQFADAVNEFSRALLMNPDSPLPKWHMGRALVAHAAQKSEDSANLFRRALKLVTETTPGEEDLAEWHRTLGRIHLALHHPLEALRHLEEVKHVPGNDKTLLLGLAHLLSGAVDQAIAPLAEAAGDPETRSRCVDYLMEIATTPPAALTASAGSTDLDPSVIDEAFLEKIFGAGSPEIHSIIYARKSPREEEFARTRVELCSPLVSGRLFAGEGLGTPSTSKAESGGSESTTADLTVKRVDDTLKPQTLLDVSEVVKNAEKTTDLQPTSTPDVGGEPAAVPDEKRDDDGKDVFDEDDWDIGYVGFDEPSPPPADKTEALDTSDLEWPDDEDERS